MTMYTDAEEHEAHEDLDTHEACMGLMIIHP